jgi:hypothetical protein
MSNLISEKNIEGVLAAIPRQPLTGQGRPPKDKNLAIIRGLEAYKAYHRLFTMAKDKAIRAGQPRLVAEIDKWLYEIEHGKPSIQIDQRVTGTIRIFPDEFKLIESVSDDVIDAEYRMIDTGSGDTPDVPLDVDSDGLDDTTTASVSTVDIPQPVVYNDSKDDKVDG